MATKTLTVTEDAYNLLAGKKLEDESFSEEITRLLSNTKTKTLRDFFGILSDKEAEGMRADLRKIKAFNIKMLKDKLKHETA